MSGKRSEVQIIFSAHHGLAGTAQTDTQRRVHSHAARVAHAKARRQRLIKYQTTKGSPKRSSAGEDKALPLTRASAELEAAALPSPIGLPGSGRRDPFSSFARRLKTVEEYLLNYYMQNVVPCAAYERNVTQAERTRYQQCQFIQLAANHANSLDGLFLVTSRHLSQRLPPHKGPYFVQLAIQYKIACAQALMEAISSLEGQSWISDATVTLAIFLAQDEILIGDIISTRRHLQGAIQMVRHNSVLKKTAFSVFLHDLIQKDIADSSLMQSVRPLL